MCAASCAMQVAKRKAPAQQWRVAALVTGLPQPNVLPQNCQGCRPHAVPLEAVLESAPALPSTVSLLHASGGSTLRVSMLQLGARRAQVANTHLGCCSSIGRTKTPTVAALLTCPQTAVQSCSSSSLASSSAAVAAGGDRRQPVVAARKESRFTLVVLYRCCETSSCAIQIACKCQSMATAPSATPSSALSLHSPFDPGLHAASAPQNWQQQVLQQPNVKCPAQLPVPPPHAAELVADQQQLAHRGPEGGREAPVALWAPLARLQQWAMDERTACTASAPWLLSATKSALISTTQEAGLAVEASQRANTLADCRGMPLREEGSTARCGCGQCARLHGARAIQHVSRQAARQA